LRSTPRRPGYNGATRPSPADPGPAPKEIAILTRDGIAERYLGQLLDGHIGIGDR
jgi:hypothetical protein